MKAMNKFNDKIAAAITSGIATMWCAYVFAGLALYGLTGVHRNNPFEIVSWVSQTFLQLVLLSIIMVGQRVLSAASDLQAKQMHDTVMEELELAKKERLELINLHKELHIVCKALPKADK